MLMDKIKIESLRTYLFTYSSVYDSISLDTLTEMYEMKLSVVQTAVNKLIIQDEIMVCILRFNFIFYLIIYIDYHSDF